MESLEFIIQALRNGTLMESSTIELKRSSYIQNDGSILAKNMVALANTNGGYVIFGVEEIATGCRVVGVNERFLSYASFNFIDSIRTSLTTIAERCDYYTEEIDGKKIVIVYIKPSVSSVYFVRHDTSPERQIKYFRNGDKVFRIESGDQMRYKTVYKYMTVDSFILNMYGKSWRFFEPNKWKDKFERRFYCAKYINQSQTSTPRVYATCVTKTKQNEAAWKVYSNGIGLCSHCLQLELDVVELRKQLHNSGYIIEEKMVEYKPQNYILKIHNLNSDGYKKYFLFFSRENFLRLLALKRDAFAYEEELRIFAIDSKHILPRSCGKKCESIDMPINWHTVIKKIRVDNNCSDAELLTIIKACLYAGIKPDFVGKKRNNRLLSVNDAFQAEELTSIEVEIFDIDDMPGTKNITIG